MALATMKPAFSVQQNMRASRVSRVTVCAARNVTSQEAFVKTAAFASVATSFLAAGHAQAAVEVANIAAGDGRSSLLLLPLAAAIGWVGVNIAGPAFNQIDNMSNKSVVGAAGLGLAAATLLAAGNADAATEAMQIAGGDNRAGLLVIPLGAAISWVLFNIAGPTLNQLDSMSDKKKSIIAGLGAASLFACGNAEAATEAMQLAGGDNRAGLLIIPLGAAISWVLFNIAGPTLNQLDSMSDKKKSLVAGLGLGAATLLAAGNAEAATEAMQLAGGDGRGALLLLPLAAAIGWVGVNIAGPAFNQINDMSSSK